MYKAFYRGKIFIERKQSLRLHSMPHGILIFNLVFKEQKTLETSLISPQLPKRI